MATGKPIGRRIGIWLLWIFGSLAALLMISWLILQTQWGQGFVKRQAERWLEKKLQTRISIGDLQTNWLHHLTLKDVYIEDQARRPLLLLRSLKMQYDLWDYLGNAITVPFVSLEGLDVYLYRSAKDSLFNFDFIPRAFVGKQGEPVKETRKESVRYIFNLGVFSLKGLKFKMADEYSGQKYEVNARIIRTFIKYFDPDSLHFQLRHLYSDSLSAVVSLSPRSKEETDTSSMPSTMPMIRTDSLRLSNTTFRLDNTDSTFNMDSRAILLFGDDIVADLRKSNVNVNTIRLRDHVTHVSIKSRKDTINEKNSVTSASMPFTYQANSIEIQRNEFSFNDISRKPQGPNTIDFFHLLLNEIDIKTDTIGYDGKHYYADLKNLSVSEKSGFRIKRLTTQARYSDSGISLNKLLLETNKNFLQGSASISYRGIGEMTRYPADTRVSATVAESRIVLDELLYFQPGLRANKSFSPLLGKSFLLNTKMTGTLDQLHIPDLLVQEGNTRLVAAAEVYHLANYKKLYVDLKLQELQATRSALLAFLPRNTIPDSLIHYIPESFHVSGVYKGTMNNLLADLKLNTSNGNATLKGTLKDIADKKKVRYDLSVSTDNIQLDKILNDSLLGPASVNLSVKGRGLELSTAEAEYKAHIRKLRYRKYEYSAINASGTLVSNTIKAQINSRDPNLLFESNTEYDMANSDGHFNTDTKITRVDLLKLGFADDTLWVSGNINAGFPEIDTAKLQGELVVSNLSMQFGNRKFSTDTIQLKADHKSDTQSVRLSSSFAAAELKGRYNMKSLPSAIKSISNRYLYTSIKDTVHDSSVDALFFANIHIPDSMLTFVPGLRHVSPFDFRARINTDSSILSFATSIPQVIYNDYTIDTVFASGVNLSSNKYYNNLHYVIGIASMESPSVVLEKSFTQGTIMHGVIKGAILLNDENREPRYFVPYKITNDPVVPYLQLMDTLILDKNRWTVSENNVIYLNSKLLKGSHLEIHRQNESLSIRADSNFVTGLPLQIQLQDFRLKNIFEVFIADTAYMDGRANGVVNIESLTPLTFTTKIQVDSLQMREIVAGNLKLDINHQAPEIFRIDAALGSNQNHITLKGDYDSEQKYSDLVLRIDSLNLNVLEPFGYRYVSKLGGKLRGEITANGSLDKLNILGSIRTDSAEFMYADYGTIVKIPAAEFVFDNEGIRANNIVITDSSGNKGTIDGRVATKDYKDFQLDLKFNTNRFLAIGRKKTPDQTIYGPTYIKGLVTIKGTLEAPIVNGTVTALDSSHFTYIHVPEENKNARGEGIIEFFNPSQPADTSGNKRKRSINETKFGPTVNMYINVTNASRVTIVLDELSGDYLSIYGTANLNFNMDRNGRMTLIGSYTVEKGEYDLSISGLIRRKFSIERGSVIRWSGDLTRADVDITAVYRTKTTAGELVRDVTTIRGIDKQKLDFEVWLMLKDRLLQPDISFRLDMPENDQNAFDGLVYTRIKQVNSLPNELNKQVMGLLVLNHFVADNPFASLSGGQSSFETQAYRTAGKLITQELTNLVGDAIEGVSIDFGLDVNEDYATGEAVRRTDLKVGVSKQLFSNRLSVYVGSTFALESENQNQDALSGLAGDVSAEYMLTSDGRYRLRAYRVNQNEYLFQGSVVKTGVTFVVVLEFDRFADIFRKEKKEK